jgi:hypothetical protein
MAYSTAGVLLQQAAHSHQQLEQQQQQQQPEPQQQLAATPVHALPSALLYVLLSVVTSMLSIHRGVQAAAAGAAAKKAACLHHLKQQMQLVFGAAARAAAAEGVEELWQLLQHPQSGSSSDSSSSSSDSRVATTTAVMAIQQLLLQQVPDQNAATAPAGNQYAGDRSHLQQQQQQRQKQSELAQSTSASPFSRLLVVLGLWLGVLWWAGRWLLLQAPAATGNAVAGTCQQGLSAAEDAAILAVGCILRVIYVLTCAVAKQLHSVTAYAAQVLLVHGTAAAQQACCLVLWVVGFANGDSRQQRSQLQQLLVQALQCAGAAAGKCGQWGMASAEAVAAAVAVKLLRDASPVTQVRCVTNC